MAGRRKWAEVPERVVAGISAWRTGPWAGLLGQVRGKRVACTQSDHDEREPAEKDPAGKSDRGRS